TNHEETKNTKNDFEPIFSSFLRALRFFVVYTSVSMLRQAREAERHQRLFDRSDRLIKTRFVNEHAISAVGRNAQYADVSIGQCPTDLGNKSDYRKIEHSVEPDHSPIGCRFSFRKTRRNLLPLLIGNDQRYFVCITRHRNIAFHLTQTVDHFIILM